MSSTMKVTGNTITIVIDTAKLKQHSYEKKDGTKKEITVAAMIGGFAGQELEIGNKRFNLKCFCSLSEAKPKKVKETF